MFRLVLALLHFKLFFSFRLKMSNIDSGSIKQAFSQNPEGLRVFHPFFPHKILNPISLSECENLLHMQSLLKEEKDITSNPRIKEDLSRIPWYSLPKIGIQDIQSFYSRTEIQECYERNSYLGQLVWAYKLSAPRKHCLLLDHWSQKVFFIEDYDVEMGARGYEFNHLTQHEPTKSIIVWPPYALEIEFTQKKWQAVAASENVLNGNILQYLPKKMPKALWELLFVLLLSPSQDKLIFQTLLDTGLSPEKGLLAYFRLIEKVLQRTETFEKIPQYRQIMESEINL